MPFLSVGKFIMLCRSVIVAKPYPSPFLHAYLGSYCKCRLKIVVHASI